MIQSELPERARTLSPLTPEIIRGLPVVAAFGLLSFVASFGLFLILLYRLFTWTRRSKFRHSQFIVLIFNLVIADIQQSVAFMLNTKWLILNEVQVGTTTCWAQGWFVSTGDLASGLMCLAIGVHTLLSVVYKYRPSNVVFYSSLLLLWAFNFTLGMIGPVLHPDDIFVRAGAWCWVNIDYPGIRLWTHYFWIFLAEFGNIVIYATLYFMLHRQIKAGMYTPAEATRAKAIAKLMVVYPLVYVVCTLPLASARMSAMRGRETSLTVLCMAGAMITSNGWLDVLLYTLTRRIALFSDEPPEDTCGIDGFNIPFWGEGSRFGTTTVIEGPRRKGSASFGIAAGHTRLPSAHSSQEFFGFDGVKTSTTVQVHSEPIDPADVKEMDRAAYRTNSTTPQGKMSFDFDNKSTMFELETKNGSFSDRS